MKLRAVLSSFTGQYTSFEPKMSVISQSFSLCLGKVCHVYRRSSESTSGPYKYGNIRAQMKNLKSLP